MVFTTGRFPFMCAVGSNSYVARKPSETHGARMCDGIARNERQARSFLNRTLREKGVRLLALFTMGRVSFVFVS